LFGIIFCLVIIFSVVLQQAGIPLGLGHAFKEGYGTFFKIA